jgi:hypothetical protein
MTPFTQTFGLSLCAIAATPGGRLLCRDTIAATHTRPHRQQRHAVASVVEPAFRQISGYLRVTPVSRGGHGVVFPSGRPLQALGAGRLSGGIGVVGINYNGFWPRIGHDH